MRRPDAGRHLPLASSEVREPFFVPISRRLLPMKYRAHECYGRAHDICVQHRSRGRGGHDRRCTWYFVGYDVVETFKLRICSGIVGWNRRTAITGRICLLCTCRGFDDQR